MALGRAMLQQMRNAFDIFIEVTLALIAGISLPSGGYEWTSYLGALKFPYTLISPAPMDSLMVQNALQMTFVLAMVRENGVCGTILLCGGLGKKGEGGGLFEILVCKVQMTSTIWLVLKTGLLYCRRPNF